MLTTKTTLKMELALVTDSHTASYHLKTAYILHLFGENERGLFPDNEKVMDDNEREGKGREKRAPDILLVALETINGSTKRGESET